MSKTLAALDLTFKNVWPAPSASSFCDITFASLLGRGTVN